MSGERRVVTGWALLAGCALVAPSPSAAQTLPSVFLERLTWTEVRDGLAAGATTVLIPTAGTEQNGPHMALGKHRFIIEHAAERIAVELGGAMVAPTMVYVPEGAIDPPSGHMRYPGTISIPDEHFGKLVEYAARSLAAHGFTDIVLLGDSGGNQRALRRVAEGLNAEWAGGTARVHFVGDYYEASATAFEDYVVRQGVPRDAVGRHAGVLDTSQLLYVAPEHVRLDARAPGGGFPDSGVSGDPTLASAELGRAGLRFKIDAALAQIRAQMGRG